MEAFKDLLLPEIYARAARSVVFRERKVQFFRKGSFKLEEDPVEYFTFWILREYSSRTVSFIRMVKEANLDLPGKGFIYAFPILEGIIDTRMIRGGSLNIASIEQIISAIDTMKGHAEWRRGSPAAAGTSEARQGNQAAWENLRIISREGEGGEKTRTALNLGAGRATRSRLRFFDPTGDSDRTVSHEREIIDLVVDRSTRENIIDSIELEEDILELSPVNRISAYRSGL